MRLSKKLRFRSADKDQHYCALDGDQNKDSVAPALFKGGKEDIVVSLNFSEDDCEEKTCIETSTLSTGEMSFETSFLSSPSNSPPTPKKTVARPATATEELVKGRSTTSHDEAVLSPQKSTTTLLRFNSIAWSCSELTQKTGGSAFDDRSCEDWSVDSPWGVDKAQEDVQSFLSTSFDGDSPPVYTNVNKIKSNTTSTNGGNRLSAVEEKADVAEGENEDKGDELRIVSSYARNLRVAELKAKKRRLEKGNHPQDNKGQDDASSSSRDRDDTNTPERIITMSPSEIATDQEILDEIKRLQVSFMQTLDIDAIEDDSQT